MTVRVLVADDQTVVREGLVLLLGLLPDTEVVGAVGDGEEAVRLVAELSPDVVLMDLRMPRMDGVTATEIIRRRHPGTEVVVLSTYSDDESVFAALRAGARGYLTKDADAESLARAIAVVADGEAHFAPPVQRRLAETLTSGPANDPQLSGDATHRPGRPVAGEADGDRSLGSRWGEEKSTWGEVKRSPHDGSVADGAARIPGDHSLPRVETGERWDRPALQEEAGERWDRPALQEETRDRGSRSSEDVSDRAGSRPRPDGLTQREVEVLGLIAQGRSNAEIAQQLHISEATVKSHINNLFAKTRVRDRAQAVTYAFRHGLAPL